MYGYLIMAQILKAIKLKLFNKRADCRTPLPPFGKTLFPNFKFFNIINSKSLTLEKINLVYELMFVNMKFRHYHNIEHAISKDSGSLLVEIIEHYFVRLSIQGKCIWN